MDVNLDLNKFPEEEEMLTAIVGRAGKICASIILDKLCSVDVANKTVLEVGADPLFPMWCCMKGAKIVIAIDYPDENIPNSRNHFPIPLALAICMSYF